MTADTCKFRTSPSKLGNFFDQLIPGTSKMYIILHMYIDVINTLYRCRRFVVL